MTTDGFEAWGRFVFRHRTSTLVASALVLALAVPLLARGGRLTTGTIEDIEAQRAQELAERLLGVPGENSFELVFRSPTLTYDAPAFARALDHALSPLVRDPRVARVRSPLSGPAGLAARMVSSDRHAAFAVVSLAGTERATAQEYAELRASVDPGPLEVRATGPLAFMHDLDETLAHDLRRAELVALPLALVVLLFVFGSAVAAVLPLGVGALAVTCGVAAVLALSRRMEMAQYTLNVVSLIGLGVAIDYSLFLVSRYRDELGRGLSPEDAVARAVDTAGRAVAFSGLAVGVGLSGLLFFKGSYLRSMGIAGAIVVAFAVAFALTFLPALLAVLGPRIERGRVRRARGPAGAPRWHALALWVMDHPVGVLVPTLALLLLLGAPFLRLELAPADVTVLPAKAEAREGYDLLGASFPAQAANRILALVRFPGGSAFTPDRAQALWRRSRDLAALPGVQGVESIVDLDPRLGREGYAALARLPGPARPPDLQAALATMVAGEVTAMWVLTAGAPQSPEALAVVAALRADRAVGDGELLVGGRTAHDLDAAAFLRERTPRAVAFVVVMTGLVLFALLGSVVLPLKAVVMNLLSVTASFGALVWLFQDGHLGGLLGFEPRPLEPALPVLLFCLVFGLSMDYEVLLLSRIQEEYLRTRDNTHAVALGLERSAGLITSAAAIMVAVFAAFALAHVVVVKATGVGLALAVALDATAVRMLVVPATMRLFGELNWWAPPAVARRFEAQRLRRRALPRGP